MIGCVETINNRLINDILPDTLIKSKTNIPISNVYGKIYKIIIDKYSHNNDYNKDLHLINSIVLKYENIIINHFYNYIENIKINDGKIYVDMDIEYKNTFLIVKLRLLLRKYSYDLDKNALLEHSLIPQITL